MDTGYLGSEYRRRVEPSQESRVIPSVHIGKILGKYWGNTAKLEMVINCYFTIDS